MLCLFLMNLIEQRWPSFRQLTNFTSVVKLCLSVKTHQSMPDVSGSCLIISLCKRSCVLGIQQDLFKTFKLFFWQKQCIERSIISHIIVLEHSFIWYVLSAKKPLHESCMEMLAGLLDLHNIPFWLAHHLFLTNNCRKENSCFKKNLQLGLKNENIYLSIYIIELFCEYEPISTAVHNLFT